LVVPYNIAKGKICDLNEVVMYGKCDKELKADDDDDEVGKACFSPHTS
jgi:hypothetical protein